MISNEFYAFHRFADLQNSLFSENPLRSNVLNHLQTKVTPMNPYFCIFEYDPKEVRVLTNLIFNSFGLADDQKYFNAACNNIFLHFCEAIMDFFIILKCLLLF